VIFECSLEQEHWEGCISHINDLKNYCELYISARSNLYVIVGRTTFGNFACIPTFEVSCSLSHFNDKFYNTEKLCRILGSVDGITVAEAIFIASKKGYLSF